MFKIIIKKIRNRLDVIYFLSANYIKNISKIIYLGLSRRKFFKNIINFLFEN